MMEHIINKLSDGVANDILARRPESDGVFYEYEMWTIYGGKGSVF